MTHINGDEATLEMSIRSKKVTIPKVDLQEIDDKNSNFSVGELQRIGLARCLYLNPKVIFLDEPTSSLDGENEEQLMEMILNLKNVTKIMITHNLNLIENCNDVFRINDGEVKKIK